MNSELNVGSKPPRKPSSAKALQLRIERYAAAGPNCPNGHPWVTNAKFTRLGYRFCDACMRAKAEARRADPATYTGTCPHGHAFTRENTVLTTWNQKICRACARVPNAKPRPLKPGEMDKLLQRARAGATINSLSGSSHPVHRGKGIITRVRLVAAFSADTPEAKELKDLLKRNGEAAACPGRPLYRWSPESIEVLKEKYEAGLALNQITTLINTNFQRDFSERAIYTKMSRMGLIAPRRPKPKILAQKLPPLATALHFPAGSILDRISAVVPRHLARDHRDDVIAEMALAIYEGRLEESDLGRRAREFVNAGYRREHDRHRTISLDEPLYDDSPIRLIDRIAAADWQSDFHIHDAL